ncbi:MAG TPA: hypothetical protein VHK91_03715 [Flavisolibacter sp.]|jgi:hypothetical protein|nr:hypothetical protein [Flavisolibacter sp.]
MDTTSTNLSTEASGEPESIFQETYDLEPYQKNMKNARIWLYVIAGLQFAMGIFEYVNTPDPTIAAWAFGIDAFVAATFAGLAFWSRHKPVTAFTIALSFYILVVVGLMLLDSTNIFRGVIIKILATIALVKAVRDARKYEAIKASIGSAL